MKNYSNDDGSFYISKSKKGFKKNQKSCVDIIVYILIAAAFITFLSGFVVTLSSPEFTKSLTEFPLSDLRGIVVDSEGRVYCGTHFYGRVQVYDKYGKFIYSIPATDKFKLKLDSNGDVLIGNVRNNFCLIGIKNNTFKKYHDNNYYDIFKDSNEYEFRSKDGTAYRIKSSFLPLVEKQSADGKIQNLIITPYYKWPLMGPLLSVAYFIMAVIIGNIKKTKKRH